MSKNYQINNWLEDNTRPEKLSRKNVEYLRKIAVLDKEMARISTISYFIINNLHIDLRTIMNSVVKQRKLIWCVMESLKKYEVRPEDVILFDKFERAIRARTTHLFTVITRILEDTEYYPYFIARGFNVLVSFNTGYKELEDTPIDWLVEDIEKWNAEHQEEVEAYAVEARKRQEIHDQYRAKVTAEEKAEKAAEKQAKKDKRKEENEIIKEQKKERARQKRIDKSFEVYYRR